MLGVWAVVALTFFNVSGGPIGVEQVITAAGPLFGLVCVVVFPWIWGVPVAMVVAELATCMPQDGGYTVWVTEAYGPFWGFQEGYWSWLSGVVDNALYPVLAMDMVAQLAGEDAVPPVPAYFAKLACTLALTALNMRGVEVVGRALEALTVLTLLPFVVMCIVGLPSMDVSALGTGPPTEVKWGLLINVLFWNYNGFDGISTFAGEVSRPARTYPRAMSISVVVITLVYLLPLLVAIGVGTPAWTTWEDGSFVAVAQAIGGDWLAYFLITSAVCAGVGLFATEMFVDSFQLYGMAQLGLAPKVFKWRHPRYRTPWPAILASTAIICVLVAFDFTSILAVDNFLSASSLLLMLLAAVRLRSSHAHLARPYQVPLGRHGLAAVLVGPCVVTGWIMVAVLTDSWTSVALVGLALVGGVLMGLRAARSFVWRRDASGRRRAASVGHVSSEHDHALIGRGGLARLDGLAPDTDGIQLQEIDMPIPVQVAQEVAAATVTGTVTGTGTRGGGGAVLASGSGTGREPGSPAM